jgi:tRNA modification GTPase
MPPTDTIAALATPAGRGALGVVRVSGPEAPRIGAAILGALPAARVAAVRFFRDSDGTPLDQGLACYFPEPASFTGEHLLEFHGHGGAVTLDRLLQRILALGARMARPGEFTERAFLNGKLDLAQAEAVADLIDAGSEAAARAAVRSLRGDFSARIRELQTELSALRVHVEAAIDFPEEDIDVLSSAAVRDRLARVLDLFASITAAARQGALLHDGVNVVIAGRPNAGKSSLLNRLAGDEIAIVTPLPGTTRDVLRQHVNWDGLPVTLIDTAGLRTAADAVEAEGIRRARVEIRGADRILHVSDAGDPGAPAAPELTELPPDAAVTEVVNKIDLIGREPGEETVAGVTRLFVSARTGAGLDLLRAHVKSAAGFRAAEAGEISARRRHLDALNRARELVVRGAEAGGSDAGVELFAEELRLAQRHLSEITGEVSSDDLLGEIFGSFCIGK